MKKYILFTEEELDDMIHGSEIRHTLSNGETVYFMCKEHFLEDENTMEIDEPEYTHDSLIFETEDNAKDVLNILRKNLEWYWIVLVSDLLIHVNVIPRAIDHQYGWINLDDAKIIKVKEGYELKMPRPMPIV